MKTRDEVIARIKGIAEQQLKRSHQWSGESCYMDIDEYMEISTLIYEYISLKERSKFLSLRDSLLADGQIGCRNQDTDIVIREVFTKIDILLNGISASNKVEPKRATSDNKIDPDYIKSIKYIFLVMLLCLLAFALGYK